MRTLLATTLLIPALALAQLPPPTDGGRPTVRTPTPQSDADPSRPGVPSLPRPTDGARGAPPTAGSTPVRPGGRGPVRRVAPAAPRQQRQPQQQQAQQQQPPADGGGQGEATITAAGEKCVPLQGRFMLAFNKADIIDVLEQASRWTCRNFIYTEDIARGKITLLSKTPVTAEEAYAAFIAALNSNNITIYASGRYYKLGRSPDSKKMPIPTLTDPDQQTPATEQVVTKVIKLRSTDADMLRGVLGNFISPQGADIQSIPPDTLIITDMALNIRRIEKILETVDKPGGGDVIQVIQLRYAAAKDVADKLNQIFQAQQGTGRRGVAGGRIGSGPIVRNPQGQPVPQPGQAQGGADVISVSKVIPDDRTNKLIVIADERSFERLQELIEQLDVPTGADGGIHVVFLRNASAEDLAQTLSNLAQGQTRRPGAAPTPAPPQQQPNLRGAPAPQAMPPGAGGEATAELFAGDVKITADKAQNALLVQASGADFVAISRLIEKLDRPRRQVFVEAVIMEVTLNNSTEFGVGAHGFVDVEVNGRKGVLPLISQPGGQLSSLDPKAVVNTVTQLGGFLTGFNGPTSGVLKDLTGLSLPSLGVVIRALQTSSDVNVISTPHVLATDNEESEIAVGQKVPFQKGFFPPGVANLLTGDNATAATNLLGTTGGLSSLAANVEREDVELRLKMKPQINEGGNVRMTVEIQNEEIASVDRQLGPTTSKRSVKTQIVAKDQSTIVIGGLIQERANREVRKVPVLGSLPVLGTLFRDSTTRKQKTNLLVFLTPYIIRDEGDYRRIFEKKRKEQEDFMVRFYGKKRGYQPDVDYGRKAGPLSRIHVGVTEETSRVENGGPGLPGEGMTTPPAESFPPAGPRRRSSPPGDAPAPDPALPPQPEGQVVPPPEPPQEAPPPPPELPPEPHQPGPPNFGPGGPPGR
ncbi:MAG TPA: type II secretion system secretin GspD [Anaeromyxobacter sp.]|nr:type II secretion system secretin GspD [Anaeromyxobacter sp.]